MNSEQIRKQSEAAYNQWCKQWREHAKIHSQYEMHNLLDLENTGVGKAILCVANGFSFEDNIETIKKYKDNVDILCCDKTLGHLLDHGITPKYAMICDANVNYEKYLKPWENKLQDTILLMNVCGNPLWTDKGNWKNIYFFINKDIIESEKEFSKISGCQNFIPAGTNVSNAMVVMLTQCDNNGKKNFFGYDKILLIGYDYCWVNGGKYYSFNEDGDGKANYMRHVYCTAHDGSFAYTSGNLSFSAQWLQQYIKTFNLPIIQCSKKTILSNVKFGKLDEQMQYSFRPEDAKKVRSMVDKLRELKLMENKYKNNLELIAKDHFHSFLATV